MKHKDTNHNKVTIKYLGSEFKNIDKKDLRTFSHCNLKIWRSMNKLHKLASENRKVVILEVFLSDASDRISRVSTTLAMFLQ